MNPLPTGWLLNCGSNVSCFWAARILTIKRFVAPEYWTKFWFVRFSSIFEILHALHPTYNLTTFSSLNRGTDLWFIISTNWCLKFSKIFWPFSPVLNFFSDSKCKYEFTAPSFPEAGAHQFSSFSKIPHFLPLFDPFYLQSRSLLFFIFSSNSQY